MGEMEEMCFGAKGGGGGGSFGANGGRFLVEYDELSNESFDQPKSFSKQKKMKKKKKKFGGHMEKRKEMKQEQLFKQVEQTKEYQETYYYQIKYEQDTKALIPCNKFWCDFGIKTLSGDDEQTPFLSEYCLFATSSINEILCCLAVIDIPFNDDNIVPQFKYESNSNSVRLIAQSPTILFAKELKKQK